MWIIIIGFILFVGVLCAMQWREQDKKDAEKATAEALKKARREKIASSPHVATIAQAIISRCGFPSKIQIDCYGVTANNQGNYIHISYASLGITNIHSGDCSTLASALCSDPLLEGKYTHKWRCETSEWDEENWLELKAPSSSTTLQEW